MGEEPNHAARGVTLARVVLGAVVLVLVACGSAEHGADAVTDAGTTNGLDGSTSSPAPSPALEDGGGVTSHDGATSTPDGATPSCPATCAGTYPSAASVATWGCTGAGVCTIAACAGAAKDCNGVVDDGCEATPDGGACAAIPLTTGLTNVVGVAVDATDAYVMESDATILRCAKTGCASATTVHPAGSAHSVWTSPAVNATDLYWVELPTKTVKKCAKANCAATVVDVATGVEAAVTLDDSYVYFAKAASLRRCPIASCAGNDVEIGTAPGATSGAPVYGMTVDATQLYYSLFTGSTYRCTLTSCTPTVVGTPAYYNFGVAVDATSVYFVDNSAAQIDVCPLAGCGGGSPTHLLPASSAAPTGVASDGKFVYWVTASALFKIARL